MARSVDLHDARVALRFGAGSEVAQAYHQGLQALSEAADVVNLVTRVPEQAYKEAWERLTASGEAFDQSHAGFMTAAHKIAGVQVEEAPRRPCSGEVGRVTRDTTGSVDGRAAAA